MKTGKKRFISIFLRVWFAGRMALQGIISNPLRSSLTILGVSIGVALVISLMGIGEGARRQVVEQFKSLGENVIKIKSHHASAEFEPEFIEELPSRVDGLKSVTPVTYAKATMKWRRTRGNVEVIGVNSNFPEIRDHALIAGRFFTELHVKQRSPVAVLGYNMGVGLWNGRNVVGSTMTLNGQTYTIIGVLAPKGAGNAEEIDNKILIPYTAALKISEKKTVEEVWGKATSRETVDIALVQLSRIIKNKLGFNRITAAVSDEATEETDDGGATEADNVNEVIAVQEKVALAKAAGVPMEIQKKPGASNPVLPEMGEDVVTITSLNQLVEEADNANRVMTLLLGGIAAVSLLVGGLGIMNIMMVSVNERTEEIGVRRAIGAKQSDLLFQFILEALYLSIIGSVVGIVAGTWGLGIFENIGFKTAFSFQAVKIATVVALTSGLLFGVYPAVSASSVPPVEALRRQ